MSLEGLTDLELYNVDVDHRAKCMLAEIMDKPHIEHHHLESTWKVFHQDVPIVSKLDKGLYESIGYSKMKHYYIRKGYIKEDVIDLIDWDSQYKAIKGLGLERRRWVTKFVTNTFGNGKMMKIWGLRESDECPHCGRADEDNRHILTYPSDRAFQRWEKSMGDLNTYMKGKNSKHRVVTLILEALSAWRDSRPLQQKLYERSELSRAAVEEQTRIGWDNFVLGRWSKLWGKLFRSMYEKATTKQLTPTLMIRQMYYICFNMWDKRNKVLHDKKCIHHLHGKKYLDCRVQLQLDMGDVDLFPTDKHLVKTSADKLLMKSLEY